MLSYSRQVPHERIPVAPYIQSHPERRPHSWGLSTGMLLDEGAMWLRSRGGIVVYQAQENKAQLVIAPRCMKIEVLPLFFAPPAEYRDNTRELTFQLVDFIELEPDLSNDPQIAAYKTMRKAFCRKWLNNEHLFDVVFEQSLWQPEPLDYPKPDLKELCQPTDSAGTP